MKSPKNYKRLFCSFRKIYELLVKKEIGRKPVQVQRDLVAGTTMRMWHLVISINGIKQQISSMSRRYRTVIAGKDVGKKC